VCDMGLAQVSGAVIAGMTGTVVTVEVDVAQGLPTVGLVGLADASIGEARHRARCAVGNTGLRWPLGRVTIGLSPAHVRKHGTGLDLPIAIGVLAADGQLEISDDCAPVIVGELGLDGQVRSIPGAITVACAAQQAGFDRIVVPAEHVGECSRVPGIDVVGVRSLAEAVGVVAGSHAGIRDGNRGYGRKVRSEPDLADVVDQREGRRALEIAAAGRHSLAMLGPPGVGKTLLAERLPGLLPDLTPAESVDVMAVHALVSHSDVVPGEDARPPFQSPHHSSSPAALLGSVSGGSVRPGSVSLAHRGVLFLDEAPEFPRNSLEALRQPLESGVVSLHRAGWSGEVPANFQLLLAANPCPCGYRHAPPRLHRHCTCPRTAISSYAQRISGPLLDRIDLRIRLQPVVGAESGESTAVVRARVHAARERAQQRWGSTNASIAVQTLMDHPMQGDASEALNGFLRESGGMRSTHRVARVAWTLADLEGCDAPRTRHIREAIELHQPMWDEAT